MLSSTMAVSCACHTLAYTHVSHICRQLSVGLKEDNVCVEITHCYTSLLLQKSFLLSGYNVPGVCCPNSCNMRTYISVPSLNQLPRGYTRCT